MHDSDLALSCSVCAEVASAEFSAILGEEEKLETSLQRSDQRLQDVCAKRERSSKYKDKKSRDAELKKQIARVQKQRGDTQKQVDKLTAEQAECESQRAKLETDVTKKESDMAKHREQAEKINSQLTALAAKRDDAINTRKANWKREAELTSQLQEIKASMDKAHRSLQMSMDKVSTKHTRTCRHTPLTSDRVPTNRALLLDSAVIIELAQISLQLCASPYVLCAVTIADAPHFYMLSPC